MWSWSPSRGRDSLEGLVQPPSVISTGYMTTIVSVGVGVVTSVSVRAGPDRSGGLSVTDTRGPGPRVLEKEGTPVRLRPDTPGCSTTKVPLRESCAPSVGGREVGRRPKVHRPREILRGVAVGLGPLLVSRRQCGKRRTTKVKDKSTWEPNW